MAAVAVLFIALIIASFILCVGILMIKRHGHPTKPVLELVSSTGPGIAGHPLYDPDVVRSDCLGRRHDPDRESDDQYRDLNDYAYIDSNQQIHSLQTASAVGSAPAPCRHPIIPFTDHADSATSGHVVCEISKRETSHQSSAQTPYSTLERNTDAAKWSGDWKTDVPLGKQERQMDRTVPPTKHDWNQAAHSYSDSILSNSEPGSRRFSCQVKAVLK